MAESVHASMVEECEFCGRNDKWNKNQKGGNISLVDSNGADAFHNVAQRQGSGSTHGCTVYLRSEERPSHSDKLWVVGWNPLLAVISFGSSH